MRLLPREHGVYGQLAFPQLAVLAAVGVSGTSALCTLGMVAAFIGHEPLQVLLGRRGTRRQRDESRSAARALGLVGTIGLIAGAAALWTAPPETLWSFAVPLPPTLLMLAAIAHGAEKSTAGEAAVATTCAFAAVPTAITAGAPASIAFSIALAYWLVFMSATFAVRLVILRVRGGGSPAAVRQTRTALAILHLTASILVTVAIVEQLLPLVPLLAIAPPLVISTVIAAFPPPPSRLRHVGWSIVAATVVTTLLLIAGLSNT